MPIFGTRSLLQLETCHEDLQRVLREAIKYVDFSVIEGHRSREDQQKYFAEGRSKLDGVTKKSRHQSFPSEAVDIVPYPSAYGDQQLMIELGRFVQGLGCGMGVELRWGGDWDGDFDRHDQTFDDLPHLELKRRV